MTSLSIKDFDAAMTADVTKNGALAKLVKAWESKNGRRAVSGAGLGLMAVSLAACGDTDSSNSIIDITTDNAAAVTAALVAAATAAGVDGAASMTNAELVDAISESNDNEAINAAVVALGIDGVTTLAELLAAYNDLAVAPLTIGIDNYAGTDADNTIVAYAIVASNGSSIVETATLSALDMIDGGDGEDTLEVRQIGAITTPVGLTVTGVEIANFTTNDDAVVDVTGWTDLEEVNVTALTGDSSVTAADDVDVDLSAGAGTATVIGGNDVTVSGLSATVGATTAASGDVDVTTSTGAVTIGAVGLSGALGDVNVTTSAQGASDVAIYGGTNVTVTANGVLAAGNITVGNAAVNASGNVVVTSTSGLTGAAGGTMGTIGVTGGDTVTVNVTAYTAAAGLAALTIANASVTQSAVTVTGDVETTAVTVNQSAAAAAVSGAVTGEGVIGVVGGAVTITDAAGAAAATADTITTVTLTNAGAAIIYSSALTELNLSTTGTAAGPVTINGQSTTTATELDLNLSGLFGPITATSGTPLVATDDTDYATVNVNVSAGSVVGGLDVADATAVNISGGGSVSLGTVTTDAAAVITSTNTGGISLSMSDAATQFVGTNSTGDDTITIFAASTADHTTGNGDDTVIVSTLGTGGSVDAGLGDDTISMTAAAAVTAEAASIDDQISNFEVLSIGATAAVTALNLANWDAIDHVVSAGTDAGDTLAVSGFASGGTFELTGGLNATGAATLTGAFTGLTDEFTVALTSATGLTNAGAVVLGGIETLNIELTDTNTTLHASTLIVTDASTTTVNISGDTGLTLSGLTALTTLDASGVTAGVVTYTAVNAASLTGGDGDDALTGSALADIIDGGDGDDALVGAAGADEISGGDGDDVITGGTGVDSLTGGDGADEFVFLTAHGTQTSGDSAATADTITDFTSADDVIVLDAHDDVAGVSGTLGTAAGTNVQVAAGGLVIFAAADDTLAEKLIAVAADNTDVDDLEVVFFEDGGNTYIYGAGTDTTDAADDYLIVLEGVTGLETLSATAGDFSFA